MAGGSARVRPRAPPSSGWPQRSSLLPLHPTATHSVAEAKLNHCIISCFRMAVRWIRIHVPQPNLLSRQLAPCDRLPRGADEVSAWQACAVCSPDPALPPFRDDSARDRPRAKTAPSLSTADRPSDRGCRGRGRGPGDPRRDACGAGDPGLALRRPAPSDGPATIRSTRSGRARENAQCPSRPFAPRCSPPRPSVP